MSSFASSSRMNGPKECAKSTVARPCTTATEPPADHDLACCSVSPNDSWEASRNSVHTASIGPISTTSQRPPPGDRCGQRLRPGRALPTPRPRRSTRRSSSRSNWPLTPESTSGPRRRRRSALARLAGRRLKRKERLDDRVCLAPCLLGRDRLLGSTGRPNRPLRRRDAADRDKSAFATKLVNAVVLVVRNAAEKWLQPGALPVRDPVPPPEKGPVRSRDVDLMPEPASGGWAGPIGADHPIGVFGPNALGNNAANARGPAPDEQVEPHVVVVNPRLPAHLLEAAARSADERLLDERDSGAAAHKELITRSVPTGQEPLNSVSTGSGSAVQS